MVEVDYSLWGTIDSSLHFKNAAIRPGERPPAGKPVEERMNQPLVFAAGFDEWGSSSKEDHQQAHGGIPKWKIDMYRGPRVEVNAAIAYVAEAAEKTNDPVMKYNAGRTLTILRSISTGSPAPTFPVGHPQQSASQVAQQFFDLESQSGPDRWNRLEKYFLETPKPLWNQVQIVDLVGLGADEAGIKVNPDTCEVRFSMNVLGQLDSSLKLSNYIRLRIPLPNASSCNGQDLFDFTMLLSELHWEIGSDGTVKEIKGPAAWRIEHPYFLPLLTLEAAIRYVTEKRATATDALVKKNADRTLVILKDYQQGIPLPNYLCLGSGGGCGG
jgi:hypothetical protein